MDVYFSPLASSLSSRIALAEFGIDANFVEVDIAEHRTMDGVPYESVYAANLVPTIRTDDGMCLSENTAVLEYIATATDRWPKEPDKAHQMRYWIGFVATEIHRGLFSPLFDDEACERVKSYVIARGSSRLDYLDQHLDGRSWLTDEFSVADAYLLTMLHMAQATTIDLQKWPNVARYLADGLTRPSVRDSIAIELPLYLAERRRLGK